MNVSVIGTGYVGLVSGTCFADFGHDVTCIDIDERKINLLLDGVSPIFEPGLDELIKRNIKDNRLHFSSGFDSCKNSDAIFLAVGTPSLPDGSANMEYYFKAIETIVPLMPENGIIVIKSTVPIGTAAKTVDFVNGLTNKKIHVVNNPEFLKEGSGVTDFMKPDRIVLGFSDQTAGETVADLYDPLTRNGHPLYTMSNLSAEMTKYAANSFLATKISFINEIAKLCDLTGADINEVRTGISSDSRIGKQFLYPGPGYGGSCFPKDVKALVTTAKEHGMNLKIVSATEEVNEQQKTYIVKKIKQHFNNDLTGKTFALWGAAYKANTDDVRETPSLNVAKELQEAGANTAFYDPIAADNFEELLKHNNLSSQRINDQFDVLNEADALIILTDWKEFQAPSLNKIKEHLKGDAIFDARNLLNTLKVKSLGFKYYAIGKKV